jgi:catalase
MIPKPLFTKNGRLKMSSLTTSCLSCGVAGLLTLTAESALSGQSAPDVAQQIAELMAQAPSGQAHQRYIHAKGIVCTGTFEASPDALAISRAAHFSGGVVPVTVRFSDGAPNSAVSDNSTDANPRGMAIRFGSGRGTDIMTISHNGFVVGTGEEFLAFQRAITATDSSKPHPWPIEAYLGSHPKALKFVQELRSIPASFATESFYSNNSFVFVNSKGLRQTGRYQIIPVDGAKYLDETEAKAKSADFLIEELKSRLAQAPARFRLLLQLAGPGDQTNDSTVVWPDDRKKVELGVIAITSVVADSAAAERELAFDPTRLTDGIELSDDPLPALRSRVYVYSVAGRRGK